MNGIVNLAGEVGEPPHYLQQYFREISEIYHYSQGPLIRHYDKKQRRGVADPDDVRDELKVFKKLQPKVAKAGERMANLLQIPEIYQEMTQFSNLLKEQYNYNEIPKDIAARKFALQAYPELKLYEKELYNKFIAEEIDTLAVNTLLKHKIDSLITCKE